MSLGNRKQQLMITIRDMSALFTCGVPFRMTHLITDADRIKYLYKDSEAKYDE